MNKHQTPIGHIKNSEAIKSVTVDGTKLSLASLVKAAAMDPKVDQVHVHLDSTGGAHWIGSVKTTKK